MGAWEYGRMGEGAQRSFSLSPPRPLRLSGFQAFKRHQIRGSIDDLTAGGMRVAKERTRWKVAIGSLECIRCKARRSVGPETYAARYFEDHARLRTQQMMCYSESYLILWIEIFCIYNGERSKRG